MIRNVYKFFGVVVLAAVAFSASADAAKDLEQRLERAKTLSAKFQQVVTDELGSVVDETSGLFELERPFKFRWIVQQPYEQEIISDGLDLWQFDKDIEQVNVSTLAATLDNSPAALLSKSNVDMAKNYLVTALKGEKDNVFIYQLKPKSEEALFEMMLMEFQDDALTALKVVDSLGQTTFVEFKESQVNQDFNKGHFDFSVPKGIDLIDDRQKASAGQDLTKPPVLKLGEDFDLESDLELNPAQKNNTSSASKDKP